MIQVLYIIIIDSIKGTANAVLFIIYSGIPSIMKQLFASYHLYDKMITVRSRGILLHMIVLWDADMDYYEGGFIYGIAEDSYRQPGIQ